MPNKHDHVTGRPRDYISRKWWHRGRHRNGAFTVLELQLEDFHSRELIKLEKAKEAQRRACAEAGNSWHTTPDGKYYCFHGIVAFPRELDEEQQELVMLVDVPKPMTSIPALPCPHENREVKVETEEYYSNGLFGIPASNLPLAVDIIGETTHCTDCGEQIFPLPALYDRKRGWHNDE